MSASKPPIPSVWTRPRRQREQPVLSQDRIVAEALKLLDEEGIDALSMRTLGTRLGAGATSIYRHVANKDELIELVVDEVYAELRIPATEGAAWREALVRCAQELRAMMLRHPWVPSVLGAVGLVQLGPNLLRQSERMLALVKGAGFPAGEADQVLSTLIAYVVGMTTSEAAYLSLLARTGQTEQEWAENLRPAIDQVLEEHPLMQSEFMARVADDPALQREQGFMYGLDRLLDGFQSRLNTLNA